jgi:ABC-type sugar transport system permease subunit
VATRSLIHRRRHLWLFVSPCLALYALVFLLPIGLVILYSFGEVGASGSPQLSGVSHYTEALDDPVFWHALKNTLVYSIESTVVLFVPAVFFAWCLANVSRFRRFYRVAVFAPVVISQLVAAVVWTFLLNPTWGPLNVGLKEIGLDGLALPWLGDSRTAMIAVVVASVWQSLGLWVVLVSAGLERIDPALYEAARIDGANRWREFAHVSLPQLWPVLRALILLWIVQAIQQVFTFVYVMTGGGPAGATQVAPTYIYDTAFGGAERFGYAACLATIVMVIAALLGLAVGWLTSKASYDD